MSQLQSQIDKIPPTLAALSSQYGEMMHRELGEEILSPNERARIMQSRQQAEGDISRLRIAQAVIAAFLQASQKDSRVYNRYLLITERLEEMMLEEERKTPPDNRRLETLRLCLHYVSYYRCENCRGIYKDRPADGNCHKCSAAAANDETAEGFQWHYKAIPPFSLTSPQTPGPGQWPVVDESGIPQYSLSDDERKELRQVGKEKFFPPRFPYTPRAVLESLDASIPGTGFDWFNGTIPFNDVARKVREFEQKIDSELRSISDLLN